MTGPELIQALQQGQEAAFRQVFGLYKDKIYNTLLGFVQHRQDAENLLQEVFIKAWEKIGSFRQQASLETWLYKIAVTTAIDFLRSKRNRGRIFRLWGDGKQEEEFSLFEHPGVLAEQKEKAVLLFRMIARLPEKQKAAFLLQKTEGLSVQAIANILSLTESATESLLSRAKTNLRESLSAYYEKGI